MSTETGDIAAYNSLLREKISEFLKAKLKEFDRDEIAPSHGWLLAALYRYGGRIQIGTLYEVLAKPKPTVTEMIHRLVALGYVKKVKSENDRRITFLVATEKAMSFKKHYDSISNELILKTFEGFTEREKNELVRLIKKAIGNFP